MNFIFDYVWNVRKWHYVPPPDLAPLFIDELVEYIFTKLFQL